MASASQSEYSFAALNVATGHVVGRCHQRHRQQEFLKFLDLIDQTIPAEPGVEIHLVMDNDATYKQSPACQTLVRQAASRPGAFLAHQYFVTQPSRTILCGNYRETDPPQRVPQRRGTQESHPRRLGSPQLKLHAISMDR